MADNEITTEFLGVFTEQNPLEKRVVREVVRTIITLEKYDREVCRQRDKDGCGRPTTQLEVQSCRRHAQVEWAKTEAVLTAGLQSSVEVMQVGDLLRHVKRKARVRWSETKGKFIVWL